MASFTRWRRKHLYKLQLWLPSLVLESDRRLGYVLLHAEDFKGTGWNPDWLTQDEALAFLSFLERIFPRVPRATISSRRCVSAQLGRSPSPRTWGKLLRIHGLMAGLNASVLLHA